MDPHENEKAIGIFDSGVGGLTVLREIQQMLPRESIMYLGDTARVPYGIRSPQTVLRYSQANADFLLRQNIKLLVIACNTASSVATEYLRRHCPVPVIDVVGPGARRAAVVTRNRRVGIIGTTGTISSQAYQRQIQSVDPAITTFGQACPLFVPLAEEGWCDADDPVVMEVARRYLDELRTTGIDTLVLGCTHYPLLKGVIRQVVGPDIALIDSAGETTAAVAAVLSERGLGNSGSGGACRFFLTDVPRRFVEIGRLFLGCDMQDVQLVDI